MTKLFVKRATASVPRCVTISQDPHWPTGLRAVGKGVATGTYHGEVLNFQSEHQFDTQLTRERLDLVRLSQGQVAVSLDELARRVRRDVERVREDVLRLVELKVLETPGAGAVLCPFESVRLDAAVAAIVAAREKPSSTASSAKPHPNSSPLENTP